MRRLCCPLIAALVSSPVAGQGVGATLEGAAWGGLLVSPVFGLAAAGLTCRGKSSEGGGDSEFWRCGKVPYAFAASLAAAGGVYVGAAKKEALPSVRRGALIGFAVSIPFAMIVVGRDGGNGFDAVGVEWAGAAVGAVLGAMLHDSEPAAGDPMGAVVMLPFSLRFQ